jgi:flavin-dependent dehydrogenase
LPRLLDLEKPSDFPVRAARFYHLKDRLAGKDFDRDKILITIHPTIKDVWYWLIPFADGTSSLGAIAPPEIWANYAGDDTTKLAALVGEAPELQALVHDSEPIRAVGAITGFARDVKQLASPQFALLGNAAEFLDPVFSSGVTIALKSADLAIEPLLRQLAGETVDWQADYARPLRQGIDTFRTFVEAWYDGKLQEIILADIQDENPIKKMIVSILAGYAWDENNSFVSDSQKYINLLAKHFK